MYQARGSQLEMPVERRPELTHSIGIIQGWSHMREASVSPPVMLRAISRAVALWRPELLVTNLRAGPATWLAFHGHAKGWDVRAIVSQTQLRDAPMPHREHMRELLELIEHAVMPTPRARDEAIENTVYELVDIVGNASKTLPKVGQGNVRSRV